MTDSDGGPDMLSHAERYAIRRRQYLVDLLRDTCVHLHTPETCMWCIQKQLDTSGPERAKPKRDLTFIDHEGREHEVWGEGSPGYSVPGGCAGSGHADG